MAIRPDDLGTENQSYQQHFMNLLPGNDGTILRGRVRRSGRRGIPERISRAERLERAWTAILQNPPDKMLCSSPLTTVCQHAVKIPGLWLEFGVFSGRTITAMAKEAPKGLTLYGFDTFEGLPENWRPGFDVGKFNRQGQLPIVPDNCELIKGLFQDTLGPFLESQSKSQVCSIVHLDADLYSATIFVLELLRDRIVPGTILVFDELINFKEYKEGEWKALLECVIRFGWGIEFLALSGKMEVPPLLDIWNTQQVALRIVTL